MSRVIHILTAYNTINKDLIIKRYIYILLFNLIPLSSSLAQDVNANGYNKFFYLGGKLASEGEFVNGKPEGEWITYYKNGNLKTKGEKYLGKSVGKWFFYNENGIKEWLFEYENDVKHGCAQRFDSLENIIEEFNYENGIKQGIHTWYYANGKLKKSINLVDGVKSGELLEYDLEGEIITKEVYDNGFLKNQSTFNRYDEKGNKTGIWRELFPDGSVKIEKNFTAGKLNGLLKEYNRNGRLISLERMLYGKVDTASGINLLELYKEFYPNGKKKLIGGLKDGVKDGIFRSYDEEGNLLTGFIFEKDTMVAEGFISPEGIYKGNWIFYYKNGATKAKGNYENGLKEGEWTYFFANGKLEQKGNLNAGMYTGSWTWYYSNGQVKRTEYFNKKSLLEGTVTEYDSLGKEIARGDYYNGAREGNWFYHVNDYKEEGAYTVGYQNGIWKGYYSNGELFWTGEYDEGQPKGKHIFYHINGIRKYIGKYVAGEKQGKWKKYDESGFEIECITYKQGEIYKINDFKVRRIEEE